ncbi:sporulation-specific diadenylate cyclase CdaS [Shimazuella sp. AN120528]|uniref:sporulation-specific diadenylate cyclase CdaS n=1 Tax=Shimazuella soli TaxID=1892854 RepID=UPI001F0DCE8F|nr:sporulation-specific diadenylate cyclase CdaS [Shimazuella soli]MCH5584836.1 sporulation-specific diadenylate cyclase CdaS [Shimazuella soli]
MQETNCDFSPLKHQLSDELQNITMDIQKGIHLLDADNYCLLGHLEDLRERFLQIETLAATFYLNCYLSPYTKNYKDISRSIQNLAKRRHGALIVIERQDALNSLIRPGIHVGASVHHTLIESIFYPGNPLHDGAILIQSDQIVSAANVLPLSGRKGNGKKLGTRHRAALGLTEKSDALVLVVSEETGKITFAIDGHLYPVSLLPNSVQETIITFTPDFSNLS